MQKLESTLEFKFSLFLETHILEEAMTMYENFKREWFMDRGMYKGTLWKQDKGSYSRNS